MILTIFNPKEAEKYIKDKGIESFDSENILPYAHDPFTLICGIVEDDEDFVALGVCKVVNEFKVIINPKVSKGKIAIAIDTLIKQAIKKCKAEGANEILAIITQGGESYENFLSKRYNFEKVNGTPLRLTGV